MHCETFVVVIVCGIGLLSSLAVAAAPGDAAPKRPRVVVMTDIGGDPDDEQSLVRFLLYANEFDIEGLITCTSNSQKYTLQPQLIRERIEAYGKVRGRLMEHVAHLPAPRNSYPPAEDMLAVVKNGNVEKDVYGIEATGPGKSSEGSRWLETVVDRDDPRPVWVLCWGGNNTLAQTLIDVQAQRSAEELAAFVSKLRVYPIAKQDSAHSWIRDEFPKLMWLDARGVWKGFSAGPTIMDWFGVKGGDESLVTDDWADEHIRPKGPLGKLYVRTMHLQEGDTPSFLYLIDNGLNVPEQPGYGGWGGRFRHEGPVHRDNVKDTVGEFTEGPASIWRWRPAYQNEFSARMDWTIKPFAEANHNPVVSIAGELARTVQPGQTVTLDASGTTDPDGDALTYRWWIYREAGTCETLPGIDGAATPKASLTVPDVDRERTLHVILEVTDDGQPPLTRYGRLVLRIQP